jgi:hypothetical protein
VDKLKLSQFPSVAAGGTATLVTNELRGRSIYAIIFVLSGTTMTKALMERMQISIDGKDIINNITGAEIQDINDYDGLSNDSTMLAFYFGDPTARTIRGQRLGMLDLGVYDSDLEIQVDVGSGASAPALQCWAIVAPPKMAQGLNFDMAEAATLRSLIRTQVQFAGAVSKKSENVHIGTQAGARLRRLFNFHSNLTAMEVRKSGNVKRDGLTVALDELLQADSARVPQSGLYALDFIEDGNQGEAESTTDAKGKPYPFQINYTTSGSDTIGVFADVHAALPLL